MGFSPGRKQKVKAFQEKIDPIQEGGRPIIAALIERAMFFLIFFPKGVSTAEVFLCTCKGGFQSPV